MIRKKVSMLGSFAVGKTSLIRRYVSGIFSERYQTTVGVKMDKKEVEVGGQTISIVLWDLHGEDEFQKVRASYLKGSSGYFLVADGTRPQTLDTAVELDGRARATVGEVPRILLVNKSDLDAEWTVEEGALEQLRAAGWQVRKTSAKTGDHVEVAFLELAQWMLGDPPRP